MSTDPEQANEVQRALRRVAQAASPAGLEQRVMRRLQEAEAAKVTRRLPRQRWYLTVGLAAACMLLAGFVGGLPHWRARAAMPVPAQVARVAPRVEMERPASIDVRGSVAPLGMGDASARRTALRSANPARRRSPHAESGIACYPSRPAPITHQEELLLRLAELHTPEALPAQQMLLHAEPAVVVGHPLPLITLNNISGDQP